MKFTRTHGIVIVVVVVVCLMLFFLSLQTNSSSTGDADALQTESPLSTTGSTLSTPEPEGVASVNNAETPLQPTTAYETPDPSIGATGIDTDSATPDESAIIVIAPDGTPVTGSDVTLFVDPATRIIDPADALPAVTRDDSISYNGVYDVAEGFVREYFTVEENEPLATRKERIAPYVTLQLFERLNFPVFDNGVSNVAHTEGGIEETGLQTETAAAIIIWYDLSVFVDSEHVVTERLLSNIRLIRFEDGWLVTDLF